MTDPTEIDDPGTVATLTRTDLIVRQELSDPGTPMTSTRTDLIDYRDPDEPGTAMKAEMIKRVARQDDTVIQQLMDSAAME